MRQTIDELMRAANCEKWPERWREIYDEAMDGYDANGCPWTDPEHYDRMGKKYGVFVLHRDVYQRAAVEVGKSEPLSRLLALLCTALHDREHISADLKAFSAPHSPDGQPSLAYDMLTGLAICEMIPYCYERLTARGLPREIVMTVLHTLEKGIDEYRKRHDGRDGYHLLAWFQLSVDGKLFRIGRLEIELGVGFRGRAAVFESSDGERVTLADDILLHRSGTALGSRGFECEDGAFEARIEESESAFTGYPYDERGLVKRERVTLPKASWKRIISFGDPCVGLHIPADGGLSAEAVDETICMAKEFLRTYYPEYDYKAFVCSSWLLDPMLADMLGEDSNIAKFGKRFQRMTRKDSGEAVFNFVFLKPDMNFDVASLPEKTRLERALKAHYLGGRAIYAMHGYFLA